MRISSPSNPLNLFRRLLAPSAIARVLWLTVALLHASLIVRRFASGDGVELINLVRSLLCLIAIGYASLKFWRIATVFDANPRRALVFGLIVLLGHVAITPPASADSLLASPTHVEFSLGIAVLPALPLLGIGLLLMLVVVRLCLHTLQTDPLPLMHRRNGFLARAHLPITLLHPSPERFRRPPPPSCL